MKFLFTVLLLATQCFAQEHKIYSLGVYGPEAQKSSYWAVTDTLISDYQIEERTILPGNGYTLVDSLYTNVFNENIKYMINFHRTIFDFNDDSILYNMAVIFKTDYNYSAKKYNHPIIYGYPNLQQQMYYVDSLVTADHDSLIAFIERTIPELTAKREAAIATGKDSTTYIEGE